MAETIDATELEPGDVLMYKEGGAPGSLTHGVIRLGQGMVSTQSRSRREKKGIFARSSSGGLATKDSRDVGASIHASLFLTGRRIAEANGAGGVHQSHLTFADSNQNDVFRWVGPRSDLGQFAAHSASQWSLSSDPDESPERTFRGNDYNYGACAKAILPQDKKSGSQRVGVLAPFWQEVGGHPDVTHGNMFCSQFVISAYQAATEGLRKSDTSAPRAAQVFDLDAKHTSPNNLENYLNESRNWEYLGRLVVPKEWTESVHYDTLLALRRQAQRVIDNLPMDKKQAGTHIDSTLYLMSASDWDKEVSLGRFTVGHTRIKKISSLLKSFEQGRRDPVRNRLETLEGLLVAILDLVQKGGEESRMGPILTLADQVFRQQMLYQRAALIRGLQL